MFRVNGTITLKNAIRVSEPYLAIAGQTSPGGVQIKGTGQPDGDWGVWFVNGAHDIVVRHLRVRMRDKTGTSRVNTTGPWPDLSRGAPAPPEDSDHDGMPDAWELA